MIKVDKIRDLSLPKTNEQSHDYVYSASGLVEFKNNYYVVADTELCIAEFPTDAKKPGKYVRVFPGKQPTEAKALKKVKPDLESITLLPPTPHASHGALLAVPSMSRPNRVRGAMIPFNDHDLAAPIPIDFSDVHKELSSKIKELNVEGIAFSELHAKLFHRGTTGKSKSAIIDIDLPSFVHSLFDNHQLEAKHICNIRDYDLGQRDGCDLAFTDACNLADGRIMFLAAAENSKNAYDDGASAGSAIGVFGHKGEVEMMEFVEGTLKLEGVSAKMDGSTYKLKLVSDSDDEKIPSGLYAGTWSC